MAISIYLSKVTLKVNRLNAPIKRWWLNGFFFFFLKRPLYILHTREAHLRWKTHRQVAKGWKKIFNANGNQKWLGSYTYIRQKFPNTKFWSTPTEGSGKIRDREAIAGEVRRESLILKYSLSA